jgi:predicted phage-related endonuclease
MTTKWSVSDTSNAIKMRSDILELFTRKNGDTWQSCLRWKIPDHYYAQVQHQLMVTGAKVAHFVAFDPDDAQMLRVKAYPDLEFYKKIVSAWGAFESKYKPK